MYTDENISIGVDLQQISIERIEPKAAHRERRIILELVNLFRVAHLHEARLHQIESQCLVLRRIIFGQRVIHIEAIELDVLQMQGAIHKDSEIRERECKIKYK